eukprot:TRINITY_DN19496_c0_g2_i1.p1 TRINITY_DN19496_c0_g2~~TRINITY_DN19496_c0_g2_i1.p1  ORF type:complete len:364 (-),score=27.13 TRINITY_DN19496_c0_g2_i1:204-1295(-)
MLASALVYISGSLGRVLVVKYMNYDACFVEPWTFTVLSRSACILSFFLLLIFRVMYGFRPSHCSKEHVAFYTFNGVCFALIEGMNMFCLVSLPGHWYALTKNSELGFTMMLSVIILGKEYGIWQYLSVLLLVAGIAMACLSGSPEDGPHEDALLAARDATALTTRVATGVSVFSSFASALLSVMAENFMKPRRKSDDLELIPQEQSKLYDLFQSNEYSMYTSFAALLPLIAIFFVSKRYEQTHNGASESCGETADRSLLYFAVFFLSFPLLTFLERIGKYLITFRYSAFSFSMVQCFRRMIGVFGLSLVLREPMQLTTVIAAGLCGVGFLSYFYGGWLRQRLKEETMSQYKVTGQTEKLQQST